MRCKALQVSLVLGLLVPVPGQAEILGPGPRFRHGVDSAWLVLRADHSPVVDVNGTPVAAKVTHADVHHYRLSGLSVGAAKMRIDGSAEVELRSLRTEETGFHGLPTAVCGECHDASDSGCGECHRAAAAGVHGSLASADCVRCHSSPDRVPPQLTTMCGGCHGEYVNGRHGRIRHAVESEHDPLRPGRRMDCASCHDPHAPECLSCLDRGALRVWCKQCHGGP